MDVLLQVAVDSVVPLSGKTDGDLPPGVRPPSPGEKGKMEVVPVLLSCIDSIGHIRVFLPNDLRSQDQRNIVRKSLDEIKRRFPDGISILDPVENMGITDETFKKLLRKIEILESKLLSNPLHNSPRLGDLYAQYNAKVEIGEKIKETRRKINDALSILQLDELKQRKRVLRRLGFTNDADVIQLKGRVACEISTGDELVLSELLLNGFFNDLSPEVIASVLSVFIFEEKSNDTPPLGEELQKCFLEVQRQARIVAKVSTESKLDMNEKEYLESFRWQLMEVVLRWCKGGSFAEIWYVPPSFLISPP